MKKILFLKKTVSSCHKQSAKPPGSNSSHRLRFVLEPRKFMDGNVEKQNEDGTFMDNGAGRGIPAMPEWPKHRERWLRAVVQDHGEAMKSL